MTINLVRQMGPEQAHAAAGAVVRAVPGRPVRRRPGPRHRARQRRCSTRSPPRWADPRHRSSTTPGCARGSARWSARSPARLGCNDGRPPATRWPRCVGATSSPSPMAGAAGWRSCWNPPATAPTRDRWCSPNTGGRAGFRRPTIPGASAPRRFDVVAQAGRTPSAAGPSRPGVGAAIGRRRVDRSGRHAAAARERTPTGSTIRSWRRCASELRRHPAHNTPGLESRRSGRPSAICAIERDNAQLENKVAAATNSLARTFDRIVGLLTERGFIHGPRRRSPGHRRRPAAGPHLQRKRPAGRRMPAHRRVGGLEARRVGGGGLGGAVRNPRR